MIDEAYGRMWVAHHDQFSQGIGDKLDALGAALRRRLPRVSRFPGQLLSVAGAIGITMLTVGSMAA